MGRAGRQLLISDGEGRAHGCHPLIRSLTHLFTLSFNHSLIHSLIHILTHE